jgi:hypothetical protein
VREACVIGDGALVVQRPDPDETCRTVRLRREDRQTAIRLHRIGGQDLTAETIGDCLCDSRLARSGRAEDRDDARRS